jgi:hypothetical protein
VAGGLRRRLGTQSTTIKNDVLLAMEFWAMDPPFLPSPVPGVPCDGWARYGWARGVQPSSGDGARGTLGGGAHG